MDHDDPNGRLSETTSQTDSLRLGTSSPAPGSNASNSRYYPYSLTSTPSAALIHSAVRSVLDDATPSTIVSDDKSDVGSFADSGRSPLYDTPTLASLRTKAVPPIPDEQDRRRFIGCLAAVLATAYHYDDIDDDPSLAEFETSASFNEYSSRDDDDYGDIPGGEGDSDEIYSSRIPEPNHVDEEPDAAILQQVPSSGSMQSAHGIRHSLSGSSHGLKRPGSWSLAAGTQSNLSQTRTRQRRYDVMCQFLGTSAELLLLDKSAARAFLPMLTRIVKPERRPINTSNPRPPTHTSHRRTRSQTSFEQQCDTQSDDIPTSSSFSYGELMSASPCSTVEYLPEELQVDDVLGPLLESLSPGSGYRCLSLLLLQYLLSSEVGYDARIRFVVKKLGVIVLIHEMINDPVEFELVPECSQRGPKDYDKLFFHATRKFESLEQNIARRLIRLSESKKNPSSIAGVSQSQKSGVTREKILRGMKIGSAGLVAGALFALTGGMAAPGIATGVAAVAGSTAAATAAVVALTSTAFVTTVFGVGGGSLAAYKMQRRTQGLTEFEFRKEPKTKSMLHRGPKDNAEHNNLDLEAELFSTIFISGWLRDKYDYQRPWGLHPTHPRLTDRLELLERFYSVHKPDHVPKCARLLASWKGEEKKLWEILREKYGRDPSHLFPLSQAPGERATLTLDQEETLDQIFVEMGYSSVAPVNDKTPNNSLLSPFDRMQQGWKNPQSAPIMTPEFGRPFEESQNTDINFYRNVSGISMTETKTENGDRNEDDYRPPKHLATVWDCKSLYGGELYTVRWESELLQTICDCVMDLAMDMVSGATRQILRQTVLSTFLAAIVWPSYLLNVANMIDGDWTLAVERADQAGKEMAKTLLLSRAGQRPVTLVGFSFGARIIYSCLKELARYQGDWEVYQDMKALDRKLSATERHQLTKLERKFNGLREPASVIEDAIIMGLPNHLSLPSWKACRRVVGGRLVNCYSTKDLILSLMFQAKRFSPGVQSILKPVCGTCAVEEPGVENIDVSDLVQGHQDYCLSTGQILERVKFGEPFRRGRKNPGVLRPEKLEY
eukprot:Nitzschia sp. Nitz4//scaffold4_size323378//124331//127668//NITZ4_000651-RA/size323378-snap-gene-0.414-mRNA-1//1//CDS//3329553372//9273//frame0